MNDSTEMARFQILLETLTKRVDLLEKENKSLKEQINSFKSSHHKLPTFASIVNNNKNSEAENAMVIKVSREIKSIERKENNVILTGLPKAKIDTNAKAHDLESEKELLTEILTVLGTDLTTVKKYNRIKNKENNMNAESNPLIIEFKENSTKASVLKNSSKLKSFNKYTIYINNDLTEAERIVEKKLREERNKRNNLLPSGDNGSKVGLHSSGRNFHWGIRNGVLKEIFHQ